MAEESTLKAGLLPKKIRDFLHVSPYEMVEIVIEDDEVKIKNQIVKAFEDISRIVKDDFEEIGVVDEDTALEYFQKFRRERHERQ